MSNPERYAAADQSNAKQARIGDYNSQADKEPQSIPALHIIGKRLENLICRLGDANIDSRLFVERVVGARPEVAKNDSSVPTGQSSVIMHSIIDLLNKLELRVVDAEYNGRELGRIG